jgi:GNAT superfamily N-acetyltransferase
MSDDQYNDSEIEIVDFKRRYARFFRDINYEWLEEYFEVEPYDRVVLEDPQKNIINLGGHIYFARVKGEVVGTCALLKHSDNMYELSKLGVSKRFRSHGVGRQLVEAIIDKARQLGAHKLVLATSKKLTVANNLYRSLGFEDDDIAIVGPLPYKRETIVMSLEL